MWDLINPLSWFVMPSLGFGAMTILGLVAVVAILLLGGSGALNLATKVGEKLWDWGSLVMDKVIIPGALNILSNGASIVVTLGCMYGAYIWAQAESASTRRELTKQRDYFANELKGYKNTLARTREELRKLQGAANRINKKLQ